MSLVYNIYFEISAAAFLVILYIYLIFQYGMQSMANKAFLKLTLFTLLANVLDVVTAITISYSTALPLWVNTLLNTLYLVVDGLLGYQFMYYSYIYVSKEKKHSKVIWINRGILAYHLLILFGNLFTGWVFFMNEADGYVHGKYYLVVYLMPFYFIACSAVIMISSFKHFERQQRISVIIYIVLAVSGPLAQMLLCPDVLIGLFTVSIGIMMMAFSLETPDYKRLLKTMEELEKTKEEAEEAKEVALAANQAKARFLANMSHEIRTPINAVLGMNEMILKESREDAIRTYAADIESSGRMLLSLINDILDFSKIESGKMEIIPVEYDLFSLINESYHMIIGRAREKNLELSIENNRDLPKRLMGDKIRIQQIIMNLLTNAVKYTAKGKITLGLDCEKTEDDRLFLKISVKDTGIGIRKEDQEKLFESFQRIEEDKNRNVEGTGLGLAITKQLVDLMEGTLSVESVYELGSVFTVSIPQRIVSNEPLGEFIVSDMTQAAADSGRTERLWAPQGRILAVDDMAMNLKVITGFLRDTGIVIDTAQSGSECLEKVKQHHYHIIFMDHMMPGMDGIETLHRLREMSDNENSGTPVIMLTANAIAGVKDEYLAEGFCDYLSKPVRESELEQMILKYLPAQFLEMRMRENTAEA